MNFSSIITMPNSCFTRWTTASPRRSECSSIASRNWSITRTTGLSAFIDDWNTVEMSRHR